jgi:ribosomal protein S18 acetylase RimI-like enzyme
MHVLVRTAAPSDVTDVVPLIVSAGGELLRWGMADREDLAFALITSCWHRAGHPVGPGWTLVAESEGRTAGCLLGGDALRWEAAERHAAQPLDPALPPAVIETIEIRESLQNAVRPPLPARSWYLASVAVAPWARRRGVASILLDTAFIRAKAEACTSVVVEVEVNNQPALALYAGAGFRQDRSWHPPGGPRIRRLTRVP